MEKLIKTTTVPYAEIRSKRMAWVMPTSEKYLGAIEDPESLMQYYDDAVVHDFNDFHGLSDDATNLLHRSPSVPHRMMADIQICAGAAHSGYPCMYGLTYGERGVNEEAMRTTDKAWGFYHELGHNYQVYCWKWINGPGSISEVCNNLHIIHSRNRLHKAWHGSTDAYSKVIEDYVKAESKDKDFDSSSRKDALGKAINSNGARLIPFIQLAQQYGWRMYAFLSTKARELPAHVSKALLTSYVQGRKDYFCLSVCEYAGVDLRLFLMLGELNIR